MNGLRVSEACAADVVDLGVERAHRVLAVAGKGGQRTLVALAPRTVRAVDAALGGRTHGPLLVSNNGGRHDTARHADPRTTRRYDRARHALDRHATYTLAAFIAEVLPSPIGDVD